MAATPVLIPVEEYLRTTYRPDCDYINGEVLERNMGEKPHSSLQGFLQAFFFNRRDAWKIIVLPEQRLQVTGDNYRIPDLMVLPDTKKDGLIVTTPPLLCIEILSSNDRMRSIQQRVDDYFAMGVSTSWAIDPWRELAYTTNTAGKLIPEDDRLTVAGSSIELAVTELWAELGRIK